MKGKFGGGKPPFDDKMDHTAPYRRTVVCVRKSSPEKEQSVHLLFLFLYSFFLPISGVIEKAVSHRNHDVRDDSPEPHARVSGVLKVLRKSQMSTV